MASSAQPRAYDPVLLEYKLTKEGYEVDFINNPLMIMGKAIEFKPDLFLLDVMMPELDGIKICRMLRADKNMNHVPIVFLTAKITNLKKNY